MEEKNTVLPVQHPWHSVMVIREVEEAEVHKVLETLQAALETAPDELTLRFCFPDSKYDVELLRKHVNHWLYTTHWPWAVVGTDRTEQHCSVMLAVRSIHEVMYGV